jgi:hypothetical protein
MPPCDFAVDSISSGFDKHDFARGKVDGRDPSARQGYTGLAVSFFEGARKLGPMRPAESVATHDVGHRPFLG